MYATRLALLFLWLLLFHFRLAACFHATRLARLSPAYLRRTHHRCLFCILGPPRTPPVSNTLRARPSTDAKSGVIFDCSRITGTGLGMGVGFYANQIKRPSFSPRYLPPLHHA